MIRPRRLHRACAPIPLLIATVGVAVFVAACGPTTSSAPPPPAESPAATGAPGAVRPCTPVDLELASAGWGGAAGSRGADVTVLNGAAEACTVDGPRVAVLDAGGAVVLESEGQAGEAILKPGASTAFSFTFSNWCEPGSALPLQVALAVGSELVVIDALAMPTVDDLPPCNGEGQPATLSTSPWAQG